MKIYYTTFSDGTEKSLMFLTHVLRHLSKPTKHNILVTQEGVSRDNLPFLQNYIIYNDEQKKPPSLSQIASYMKMIIGKNYADVKIIVIAEQRYVYRCIHELRCVLPEIELSTVNAQSKPQRRDYRGIRIHQ